MRFTKRPDCGAPVGFIHRQVGVAQDLVGRPLLVVADLDDADAGVNCCFAQSGGPPINR